MIIHHCCHHHSLLPHPLGSGEARRRACGTAPGQFTFNVATVTDRGGVPCRGRHRCFLTAGVVMAM